MGSSNQVGVERVGTGGVQLYADVTGLPPSLGMPTAYVARVSAANAYLQAVTPVTANVAAYPKVTAPSVPLLVRATALSDTQIAVWWSPPLQSGGAMVTGYSVQWDITASFGPTSYSAQVQQGATFLVLPNLVAGTSYTIRVAAYNAQGYGPFVAAQVRVEGWAEIQAVLVNSQQTFTLQYTDQSGAPQSTGLLPVFASALQVQDALQRLGSGVIRTVLVSKEEQSDVDLYDLTVHEGSTYQYKVLYKITFVDAGYAPNQHPLVGTYGDGSPVNVITLQDGQSSGSKSLYLTPRVMSPSAPTNVTVTVVSNSELGVQWNTSVYTGERPITKFLVEWDILSSFPRR